MALWAGQRSRYSDQLRAGRSGDQIPVGARFSAPVQAGPGAYPASCTMGTGSFQGVKSGRGVTLNPHPFQCRGQERVELYLYSPYGPYSLYRTSVPVKGCTSSLPLSGIHCGNEINSKIKYNYVLTVHASLLIGEFFISEHQTKGVTAVPNPNTTSSVP